MGFVFIVSYIGYFLTGVDCFKRSKISCSIQYEWMQSIGQQFFCETGWYGADYFVCSLRLLILSLFLLPPGIANYKKANNFFALMLLAQAGLMGVFLAMDALLFYFFWELALIPDYFLCSQWGGEKRIQVTFKFFIYTFVGSVLMLIGIIYVYS